MRVIFLKLGIRVIFVLSVIIGSCIMWLSSMKNEVTPKKAVEKVEEKVGETPVNQTPKHIEVQVERNDGMINLDIEAYLQGVIGSEMPASFEMEALKAQAVAARTFACKREYKVDDTTSSQVYHDDEQLKEIWKENYEANASKIKEAITSTAGEIITYEGTCITAAFFSSSTGATNNSEDYWKDEVPYLRSVDSPWDQEVENYRQSITLKALDFSNQLGFEHTISEIKDIVLFENGYVKSIHIDGIIFSGREMREKLKLRSSAFEIERDGDNIIITTHGYGHGIGLSQYGAQAMALSGKRYDEIIKHYYTGVEISKIGV